MKELKNLALVIMIMATAFTIHAQEKIYSHHINIGYSKPIFHAGHGVSIGYNPSYSLSRYISLEGQASYAYTRITGSFLSGKKGDRHSGLLLVGGRIYFNVPERTTRYYINGMLGGGVTGQSVSLVGSSERYLFHLGASAGLFMEKPNFVFGLAFDVPVGLVAKVGYRFPNI